MKQVLSIFICILVLGGFSSCKKDWTCQCSNLSGTDSVTFTIKQIRKNDAKTQCHEYGNFIGQCEIK